MDIKRELIPAALVPTLTANGATLAAATRTAPGNYLLFVDTRAVDIRGLEKWLEKQQAPDGVTIQLVPVHLRVDQRIEDAVALYEVNKVFARFRETGMEY